MKVSQIYDDVVKKTNNGVDVPFVDKNGVKVPKMTIFEDIVRRNLNNLNTVAIEMVNGITKLTYGEFFLEVEKYMSSFKNLGLKEGDVVSLCLPVGVEFICAYFALTTMGVTVNALNIMFLFSKGIKPYLSERCSNTLICDENYYKLLLSKGVFNDDELRTLIITGDASYTHFTDSDKIEVFGKPLQGVETMTFTDFISNSNSSDVLQPVEYDENRISTLNYTSGTTGTPKCMGHSDLAPLFLNASHDTIRRNEYIGDRSLITIPFNHPTGLFYAMVLQMAQGKTLVLEPRYDRGCFIADLKTLDIKHTVQATPFWAETIHAKNEGILKPGDLAKLDNPYSGGAGCPLPLYMEISGVLRYCGCIYPLQFAYGRSEEGSCTVSPYNLFDSKNTCGIALPGIKSKIVDAKTLKDIPQVEGAKGEILVSTPVHPINHCYLDSYNKPGKNDGSITDEFGEVWARCKDIGTYVELNDGTLSLWPLGRAEDSIDKNGEPVYLFELKDIISQIPGVLECEVVSILHTNNIGVHIVVSEAYKNNLDEIVKAIYERTSNVDGVKVWDKFNVNATSGKCDHEGMVEEKEGYYTFNGENIEIADFDKNDDNIVKRVRKSK